MTWLRETHCSKPVLGRFSVAAVVEPKHSTICCVVYLYSWNKPSSWLNSICFPVILFSTDQHFPRRYVNRLQVRVEFIQFVLWYIILRRVAFDVELPPSNCIQRRQWLGRPERSRCAAATPSPRRRQRLLLQDRRMPWWRRFAR